MGRTRASTGSVEPAAPRGQAEPATPGSSPGGGASSAASASGASFESSTERLASIVAQLESGELPLEESLRLFEEGVQVARAAQKRLDEAEQRVEELLGVSEQGEPLTRDFEG